MSLGRAALAYERNDLAQAERLLTALDEIRILNAPGDLLMDGLVLLARLHTARGCAAAATVYLDEAEGIAATYQGGGSGDSRYAEALVLSARIHLLCTTRQTPAAAACLARWTPARDPERRSAI